MDEGGNGAENEEGKDDDDDEKRVEEEEEWKTKSTWKVREDQNSGMKKDDAQRENKQRSLKQTD